MRSSGGVEAGDERRQARDDEVERPQPLQAGWLGCDLADQEPALPLDLRKRGVAQVVDVLDVYDVGLEVSDLREQDVFRRVAARAELVLACPGRLELRAVDDDLVRLVSERREVVRVRVGGSEEGVHQCAPLRGVRLRLEARRPAVVRLQESRVVGVDDEDAHRARTLPTAT